MGRKIINGIDVNTNLKRQRVEVKQGCQSTILESAPKYYWQFEVMEEDDMIDSVLEPKLLSPTVTDYGKIVSGIDGTNGLQVYLDGIPEPFTPTEIELVYELSDESTPVIGPPINGDDSPLCPVPSLSYEKDSSQVTFTEALSATTPSYMDAVYVIEEYMYRGGP